MSAHTAAPWRVGDAGHTVFGPPNGTPFPTIICALGDANPRANAAYIVAACNAHDDLVAALRQLLVEVDAMTARCGWAGNGGRDLARTILAKVQS